MLQTMKPLYENSPTSVSFHFKQVRAGLAIKEKLKYSPINALPDTWF